MYIDEKHAIMNKDLCENYSQTEIYVKYSSILTTATLIALNKI